MDIHQILEKLAAVDNEATRAAADQLKALNRVQESSRAESKYSSFKKINEDEQMAEKIEPAIKTNPAERGKYAGKDIGDLKAMKKANLAKTEKYRERGEKVPDELKGKTAELNFAIRAKQAHGGKWGKIKEEEMEEGNDFTKARLDAIRAGKPTFKVDGKTYRVTGDTSDEKAQMNESQIEEDFVDFLDKKQMYRKIGADVDGKSDDYVVTFKDGTRKRYQDLDGGRRRVTTLEPIDRNDEVDDEGEVVKRGRGRPKGTGRKTGTRGATDVRAKKKKVTEATGNLGSIIRANQRDVDAFMRSGDLSDSLYQVLFDYYMDEMPYGTAKARTGDPYEWISDRFHDDMGGGITEDYDKDEYDEEGEMAKSQARTIEDAAQELQDILDDDENLPEWVQKKIVLAKEYIDSARDYLKANRPELEMMSEKAVSQAQRKAAGIAYAAKKGDIPKSELRGASKAMADMPAKELKKFAKTKEKDLPEKVKETTVSGSVATAPAGGKAKGVFGKGIYESLEKEFTKKLDESMSVNVSANDNGQKNITVTASDDDAEQLSALLKMAGLFGAGGYTSACPMCGQMHEDQCTEAVEEDYANTPEE